MLIDHIIVLSSLISWAADRDIGHGRIELGLFK